MDMNLIILCSSIMLIAGFLSGLTVGKELQERKDRKKYRKRRYYNRNNDNNQGT